MTKTIAIVQSSYIPWKGYFDLISQVNEFILYDDVQYTRRDWRSRNIIKTSTGLQWLTIPVNVKGKFYQKICEATVSSSEWAETHWKTILHNYRRAVCFEEYKPYIESIYQRCAREQNLSQINYLLTKEICKLLDISTHISWSTDYPATGAKTERLITLCQAANATHYISGPSAKEYIAPDLFKEANIELSYIEYGPYPEYIQLYGKFEHNVSILDLIFNMGQASKNYIRKQWHE